MRKHARFFYILFIIVILSFIFWGVGTVDKSSNVSAVAEVGKSKITAEEYWRAYDNLREAYQNLYKGQFTGEMEKKMKLKEVLLDNLIDERVLLLSAKELGLSASDRELQDAITADPRFMRDGVFRQDIYFRTLRLNRLTPEMFEASLRRQIVLAKMRNLIGSAVDATPADLKGISGDDKKADELKQSILAAKRNLAVKAYIDSIRQKIHIKINSDLLANG